MNNIEVINPTAPGQIAGYPGLNPQWGTIFSCSALSKFQCQASNLYRGPDGPVFDSRPNQASNGLYLGQIALVLAGRTQ